MPLCSILIRGILRILPDFAPGLVSTITGLPFWVPPSAPLVASYNSTCRRTRSLGLGSYSPLRGILKLSLSKLVTFFSWCVHRRFVDILVNAETHCLPGIALDTL